MSASLEPRREGQDIIVPQRAQTGDTVGIGWVRLSPGDDDYEIWDEYLRGEAGESTWSRRAARQMGSG